MKPIETLYRQYTGMCPEKIERLTPEGSNRQYFRLSGGEWKSIIGVIGTSAAENHAFISLSKHFRAKRLPVPEVYAVSDDGLAYIQQDLGSTSLFEFIANGRKTGSFSNLETELLKKTIALLPDFQFLGAQDLDYSVCYPQPEFDERMISFDLNYFKYCFLKPSGLEFSEIELDNDFKALTRDLLKYADDNTFMYRDFQSRNVMVYGGEPYFIDFQGGRRGPIYYDVASFLWQAKARYTDTLRKELLQTYIISLQRYLRIDFNKFTDNLNIFLLFRTLQVLGAYGFRGKIERKPHFLESIPFALENLDEILQTCSFDSYPYLTKILTLLCNQENEKQEKKTPLTVSIYSFSFKKGMPYDASGNGGGYTFDCRSLENPGRYEEYKHVTGMDKPVIDFLKEREDVKKFLHSVDSLVDAHAAMFISRSFTNLMVCFGCTGGQHRSVFCAEHLAAHLKERFGDSIKVKLIHREQNIEKRL